MAAENRFVVFVLLLLKLFLDGAALAATTKSPTLQVHIFSFMKPTQTRKPPFDSAFQALYIAPTFVYLQYNADNL